MDSSKNITKEEDTKTSDSSNKDNMSDCPGPSSVSMKSDRSMEHPQRFKDNIALTERLMPSKRAHSPEPSLVSNKSSWSIEHPDNFRDKSFFTERPIQDIETESPEPKRVFKERERCIDHPAQTRDRPASTGLRFYQAECHKEEESLKRTELDLADMSQKLKSRLMEKCKRTNIGIYQPGSSALLNEIYTELYITEGWSQEINIEHEVRQIETASRTPATEENPIKCNELFKDKSVRTALTKGVAGVGKTVFIRKFILDWAEGKANQDVRFMFLVRFRELNLIKQKTFSLMNLLHHFFPELKALKTIDCNSYKVIFILSGVDECQFPLNFENNEIVCDVTESASVDVLLTNLIKGNLLPSALIWIISRPAAATQIPSKCLDLVTEIQGFKDPQKEEYFRKRISDQVLANRIIRHLKSTRSLYIMCHLPVFCWISASVLEKMLEDTEDSEIPRTLTQMFTHFLVFEIQRRGRKYQGKCDLDPQQTRSIILALGKLAFQQLEQESLVFSEDDLTECGIDVREASVYSGVCTQIFREEFGLYLGKVFSFVHVTVQEFLAALFVFLCFIDKTLPQQATTKLSDLFNKSNMSELLKGAVDKALQCKNGNLDLFVRFLLGLSMESNQTLLRSVLPQTGSSNYSKEETVKYIKRRIRGKISPEKSINLLYCLSELNDQSLVQEVQSYLKFGGQIGPHKAKLSTAQWSTLAFMLLNSEQELEEFDLRKYVASQTCLLKLLPVVKASRVAVLQECKLTKKSCEALASVLSSSSSNLREIILSNNNLQDSGIELLSKGLASPLCRLEVLRLCDTKLTKKSCEFLSSVLGSSSLTELDLSDNDLQDSGVTHLSAGLKQPLCKLKVLSLSNCRITNDGVTVLNSALRSNPSSHLRQLNLSNNNLGESGKKLLRDLQEYIYHNPEKPKE